METKHEPQPGQLCWFWDDESECRYIRDYFGHVQYVEGYSDGAESWQHCRPLTAAEIWELLKLAPGFQDWIHELEPETEENCSCHINPPCSNCIDRGNEMIEIESIKEKYEKEIHTEPEKHTAADMLEKAEALEQEPAPSLPVIDWSAAPDWAMWHAYDAYGKGINYSCEPDTIGQVAYFLTISPGKYMASGYEIDPAKIDWKTTLQKRPQEPQITTIYDDDERREVKVLRQYESQIVVNTEADDEAL